MSFKDFFGDVNEWKKWTKAFWKFLKRLVLAATWHLELERVQARARWLELRTSL